jgi:hypothetical protein
MSGKDCLSYLPGRVWLYRILAAMGEMAVSDGDSWTSVRGRAGLQSMAAIAQGAGQERRRSGSGAAAAANDGKRPKSPGTGRQIYSTLLRSQRPTIPHHTSHLAKTSW